MEYFTLLGYYLCPKMVEKWIVIECFSNKTKVLPKKKENDSEKTEHAGVLKRFNPRGWSAARKTQI